MIIVAHVSELGRYSVQIRAVPFISYRFIVKCDLPYKFINEQLAGYDWLKYFLDRNLDTAERNEETSPNASGSQANNSANFESENSPTNSEAVLLTGSLKPPVSQSEALNKIIAMPQISAKKRT